MSQSDDRWSPVDGVLTAIVSLAHLGVITGSTLVMTAKRSSSFILPLEDGAYPGGLVAAISAVVVLLGSFFLRNVAGIGLHALFSVLLFGLPLYAWFLTSRRASHAFETPSSDVYAGQDLYAVAGGIVALAALVGIVRYRLRKRGSGRS